jgi:hypothetical protein
MAYVPHMKIQTFTLRFIIVVADLDVSRHILRIDISNLRQEL